DSETMVAEHSCIQPETYYFCSPGSMTGAWNPMGYDWLRRNLSRHFLEAKSGPPIFLTRRSSVRMPENLPLIEDALVAKGFEIVDCSQHSVRSQITKISAAPMIAGLHGAAMTNLLWAPPQTPVIEIFQPGHLNGCYEQIAFHGSLIYSYGINEANGIPKFLMDWLAGF
ncbi:MAG: glycosyltransferase family 61 protein, partial [Luteolibacter sp.]